MSRVLRAAVAVSLAATLAACGGDDDSEESESLKVGYSFGFDAGDTGDRIAFDRFTEQTGAELEFVETGGGSEAVAALTRGDIDVAKLSLADALNAIGQGAEIKLIVTANPNSDLLLVGGPDVETVGDLPGKQVLLSSPGPSTAKVKLPPVLAQAGVEESDFEVEYVQDSQDRAAALVSGRADATTLETTDVELISPEAEVNRLASLGHTVPEPNNSFVVRADFADENRVLLEDFVSEMLAGYETLYGPGGRDAWVEKAREEELADQPEEVAERIYEAHRKLGYWPHADLYTEAEHQRALDYVIGGGLVEKPVPFDEAWDISFWSKAAEGD